MNKTMDLQMVDLKKQYLKIKPQIDEAIEQVLLNSQFIGGPQVNTFQKNLEQYLGVQHVIPCANGTDALQIAMMALGLKPGDEVITPSFTYIATTEVIALLGLTPVFVDVDPLTFCIDSTKIEEAITEKTKLIVPVHLYGQAANMEEILSIASKHNLFVIEDNAQAIGSDYTFKNGEKVKLGAIGTIGCTSFFPSKNLGCYGDGGAISTNDTMLAEKIKMIANHGQKEKYVHEVVGCNSRLDAIQAAILNVKLPLLDTYIQARQEVAKKYNDAFAGISGITTPQLDGNSTHVFHQYTLRIADNKRAALQAHLAEYNVPTMIYYPKPAHKQGMFATFNVENLILPVTEELTKEVISLPIHTEMEQDEIDYIIHAVLSFFN